MRKLTSALQFGLALGSVLLCGVSVEAQHTRSADSVGIARTGSLIIRAQDAPAQPAGLQPAESQPQLQPLPGNAPAGGHYQTGEVEYYPGGACPNCPGGVGYGCGNRFGFRVRQFFDWFNPCGMCVHSPDHGFCPPAKRPIYYRPVAYTQNYPPNWSGQAGYPAQTAGGPAPYSVYWPTDTTQLGYYYQQVPQWYPNPGMYPSTPPNPGEWHQTVCQQGGCPTCPRGPRFPQFIGNAPVLPYPGAAGYCPTCRPGQTYPATVEPQPELAP